MSTLQGFLNIYKPSGMTSSKVVTQLKKKFHFKKIGHMGTLDPMACGILPIAIGKATRMFDYFMDKIKTYVAIFDFNYTTNTLDATGEVLNRSDIVVSLKDINNILSDFHGKISQMPPQYSAKSINGKRAYEYARSGEYVELKPKDIEIYNIECLENIDSNIFKFEITCSSGTYIRSIVRDIATKLNTTGCMTYLERTKSGSFDLNCAIQLNDILTCESVDKCLIPIDKVFDNMPKLILDDNTSKILNGLIVKVEEKDDKYLLYQGNILVGIGKIENGKLKLATYLKE